MFGIDISKYQSNIDWQKVKTNVPKVDFVFIKATQGVGYTDNQFYVNVVGAEAAQIPWSAYHFCSLNDYNVRKDAADEANYFLSVLKKAVPPKLPLVLDIEIEDKKVQLDDEAVKTWIVTFFDTLKAAGHTNYILYSYASFLNEHLPANHGLGNIPLWLAAYTSKPKPILPKGWSKYAIWQYSDKGKVAGIYTPVDINKTVDPLY